MKPLLKHKLSKSIQYFIWIVVLLRFIIPFSFEGSLMNDVFYSSKVPVGISSQGAVQPMVGNSEQNANSSLVPNARENVTTGVYNADPDHSRYFKDSFNQYAVYLWLLGIIITLAVNLTGYARFLKHLRPGNKPATDEQNRILAALEKGRYKVSLVRNRFVTTPMLVGILKPSIIVPDSNFDEIQLKNILLHEISHLRRFDIGVKWLTMLATSIHWFNPLMQVIKKEVNHACELACDEAVIKNLNPAEKQAYGNTLITVVAEHKYPFGVLQATMCEEKKSLKERLIAIMNHQKKSKLIKVLSVVLLVAAIIGAIGLGASVSTVNDNPPTLYISAEGLERKAALTGSYSWENRGNRIQADSDNPIKFKYQADNIVNTAANQPLIISAQKLNLDKKYDFTLEQISEYKAGQTIALDSVEHRFMTGNLYLPAPPEAGEYIYSLDLNFKDQGTVTYGFVVRVDMLTYNLPELAKHKTPYIGNASKVAALAGRLPVPDSDFKQQYISMFTSSKPYKFNVFYEVKENDTNRKEWAIENPNNATNSNLRKNALVLFCMIDNLDEVTFAFRKSQSSGDLDTSKYDTSFTFQRHDLEKQYGDLTQLGKDLDLLQDKLDEETTKT
ncbi:M56 family metallopeptidase [Desulfosporosinus fructosivorans]